MFFQSNQTGIKIGFSLFGYISLDSDDHDTYSKIWFRFDDTKWQQVTSIRNGTYGWKHICLSFDFTTMKLFTAVDQQLAASVDLAKQFDLRTIKINWDQSYVFPEMFTMLNIHSRYLDNSSSQEE